MTLTDLTPSTGQTEPNGEVGVDGIHGHRVEKVIRLRIQIRDQYDVEPTYPVLVRLTTGGPRHGTLILDPDGTRTECPDASFLWHERDAQGNLVALNEEFEYRMGTWSRYVGVEPDPNNPPQVRPVWGVAEDLGIRLETTDGAPLSYRVHPEPGKPDHFACWEGSDLPCGDEFAHWTGIFSGITLTDVYHLEDGWGNATFGYTDTDATQPGGGVSVQFTDQTAGTGGDFAGYTLATQWPTNPAPSGQMPSTLSVDYPDDPAGDWLAGTAAKTITYDFSGGGSHLLIQKQNYDARFGVDESAWPLTVPPGAGEGAMPKTASGDTPRLVLLALSGSRIPSRIPAGPYYSIVGEDEPSLDSTHVYRNTGGSWNWVSAADQDVALETAGGGEFRLSLVDGSGTVVPGTSFRVRRCPRGEHLTAESPPGDCTLGPVDSEALTGVLSSLTLNEAGSQRGYLGIELTEAPVNPGTYFILVESIGSTPYRIRWQSQLFGRSAPEEDLKGGFVICTVLGGEILDENFQRVAEMLVDRPTQAYVRIVDPNQPAGEIDIAVSTYNSEDLPVSSDVPVAAARVGNSSTFIGAIVLTPLGYESLGIHHEGASYAPQGPEALVDAGKGLAVALRNNFRVAYQSIFLHPRLAVEWLNEQGEPSGEQITRIVKVPDPTLCDHSLYVEETLLRVFAKNLLGRRLTKVDGLVRLDEKPDTAFPNSDDPRFPFTTTLDWQYAYQGNRGASSDLRQDRAPDTDPFAAIVLANGQTETLRLRSVAGPRLVTDNLGLSEPRGFFVRTWKASIEVCESLPNTPCENTPVNRFVPVQATVDQWVDQQTYHRHSPGGGFQRENGQNEVRDWLEAVVWDALSDCASRGELMDYVCSQVWELKEEPGSGADHEFAHVDLDSSHGVFPYQIYVYPQNFGWDAFRWDTRLGLLNYGFLDDAHGVLTSVALHEARHSWQWKVIVDPLGDSVPDDSDHDLLPSLPERAENLDPVFALRLKDSPHSSVGGGNFEAHLAGDLVGSGDALRTIAKVQRERDAAFFEQRATVGLAYQTDLTGQLTEVSKEEPTEEPVTVHLGTPVVDGLVLKVAGRKGTAQPWENTRFTEYDPPPGAPDVVVEARVSPQGGAPKTGLELEPQNSAPGADHIDLDWVDYVAVTDGAGKARFTLKGLELGTYTVTCTVRQMRPEGNEPGEVLRQFVITVEVVTP